MHKGRKPVCLYWTLFSYNTINHHVILTQTSGDMKYIKILVVTVLLFPLSQYSRTPTISTVSQVIDDMSRLKLQSIYNSQKENDINMHINLQLNSPIIPFCLSVDTVHPHIQTGL